MSYICNNGPQHTHELASEGRACWGFSTSTRSTDPRYPATPSFKPVEDMATPGQINYLVDLGMVREEARSLTKKEASNQIERLKAERARRNRMEAATRKPAVDPRLDLIKGMIEMLPEEGYFAVQKEEGAEVHFLRLSRPKKNNYAGSIKIQTQHGPRFEVAAAYWLNTQTFQIYRNSIVEPLLWLIADYKGAALRYARIIGKCCRCNSPLTDTRSRHYGIGPECEQYWPWVIEEVDAYNES